MLKIIFIISILFYSSNWVESLDTPVITNSDNFKDFAINVRDILNGDDSLQDLFGPGGSMVEVMDKVDSIIEQTENLDPNSLGLLKLIIAQVPADDKINTDVGDLQDYISEISDIYNAYLAYSKSITNFNSDTLNEFASIVTSDEPGNIGEILYKIYFIFVPPRSDPYGMRLLQNLNRQMKIMDPLKKCDPKISYQNQLLQIYNMVAITELKAFLATSFAYKLKKELNDVDTKDEIEKVRRGFSLRIYKYLSVFSENMMEASRELFLCDPESLTDQNTYVELEGLFTAYVINEYETNLDYDYPCWKTCPDISIWTHYRCYDLSRPWYCPMHPCKGLTYKCEWIGGDVDLCELPKDYLKRYDWVRSYSNGWYGKWSNCEIPGSKYSQVNGQLNRAYRCDTCICKCEESYGSSKAIRTFSLRPQISNIDENKVVSDVKFTLKDKMVHIQIEEAPLLPLGQLDRNQSSWVPLEDFIYLSNVTGGGWVQVKDGQNIPMTRDTDFAFIRRDQRVLNIDEISGGPNYILTGVRLSHESETYTDDEDAGNISPLQLEIHVTPFDYASGKLIPTEQKPSKWFTSETQPIIPPAYSKEREELKTGERVYKYESAVNPPVLESNKYITFKQSTIFDDAGQSTVPFMDSRPVASSSPTAFDGLGLAFRGDEKYAGFIMLKALTLDFSNYMS